MAIQISRPAGLDRTNLAYNLRAFPYDHGIQDRQQNVFLSVEKLLGDLSSKYKTPPIVPSHEEQTSLTSDRVLWIGMFIPNLDLAGDKTLARPRKATRITDGREVSVIRTNPKTLRVGVDVKATQLRYYYLINQTDGLSLWHSKGAAARNILLRRVPQ